MTTIKYKEIVRRQIGKNRFIVVSERSDGRFAIAQQIEVETDIGKQRLFVNNSIVVDKDGVLNLMDALDFTISKLREP